MNEIQRQRAYAQHVSALADLFAYLCRGITGGVSYERIPQALHDAFESYVQIHEGMEVWHDPHYLPAIRERLEEVLPRAKDPFSLESDLWLIMTYCLQALAAKAQHDASQHSQAVSKLVHSIRGFQKDH